MATARRGGSYRDLILTLLIFGFGIVALVAFLPKSNRAQVLAPIAYAVPLASLRSAAPFPVYAPAMAPTGWTVNHAVTHVPRGADPTYSLDLGFYVRAVNQYLDLQQSSAADFTAATLRAGAHQTGTTVVGTTTWQTWTDGSGHPAFVRAAQGSTIVLGGVTDRAHLQTLAAALSLVPATDAPGAVH